VNAPADLPPSTTQAQAAEELFARLAEESSALDLFQAMRRIEQTFSAKPRLGDGMRPVDEPFRFAQEASLISAMKGAKTMTVAGTSKRGTTTTDTYSLTGLGSALDAIAKACPVK